MIFITNDSHQDAAHQIDLKRRKISVLVNVSLLKFYIMSRVEPNQDELDESPIQSGEEEAIEIVQDSSSEEEEMFDSQTFKGSFLQEMEKLCRPLKFEKINYSIYEEYDYSEQNILGILESEEKEQMFSFNLEEEETYIINFNGRCCDCECRLKQWDGSNKGQKGGRDEKSNSQSGRRQQEEEICKAKKPKQYEKGWTSLSLKEYKLRIKRKLQEKR